MNQTASQKAKAKTSLNQVPALLTKKYRSLGPVNLDWGGGKYNTGTEFLATKHVENLVYDPYNRDSSHNGEILMQMTDTRIHSITCANVLNVLKSKAARTKLLYEINTVVNLQFKKHDHYTNVYFTMYEKDGSGIPDENLAQTNMKTFDYIDEMSKVFGLTLNNGIFLVDGVITVIARYKFIK